MKISDVVLQKTKEPGLLDFIDNARQVLNNGRYQFRVIDSIPTWSADEGECLLYASGTTRRQYSYINGQWCYWGFVETDGTVLVDGEVNIGSYLKANDSDGLWLGHTTWASAPFRVNLAGDMWSTSATITGNITANTGSIGGWTIASGLMYAGTGATYVGMAPGTYPFYAGSSTPASAPFYVTTAGAIHGTSGDIGGWTLASDRLSSGTDSDYIGLMPGTGIWMGDSTFAYAEFSVDENGLIKATSGTIGGWTLSATTISSTNLQIDSGNERIQTTSFTSGPLGSGWRIDNSGAEFQNIRARGKISTSVFEKDTISAVGGNFLVMDSDILSADMTALDASTLTISGDTTFAVNDILRMKDGVDDEWLLITNVGSAPTYTVTRDQASIYDANTNPIWKKGTAVVNYGGSGEGGIYMTSSEDSNTPYIHFFTHAGSPWSTTTPKTRIGNLNGVAGCTGYGIWGGAGFLGALSVIDLITISSTGSIRSNTAGNYPYVEFSNSGLMLKDSDTGGTYGTAKYGTDKYGYGALVWIMNSTFKIPWVELKEPTSGATTVASFRLYNRSATPTGTAEVGDLAVANGKLYICTGAGTPGTWTVVGSQS